MKMDQNPSIFNGLTSHPVFSIMVEGLELTREVQEIAMLLNAFDWLGEGIVTDSIGII